MVFCWNYIPNSELTLATDFDTLSKLALTLELVETSPLELCASRLDCDDNDASFTESVTLILPFGLMSSLLLMRVPASVKHF